MSIDLLIRPADVLLFRDGRPFSAGDDHRASGLFPPPPSAFYGGLRAAALTHHGARFSTGSPFGLPENSTVISEMGGLHRVAELTIEQFSLAHAPEGEDIVPLFPLPADVLSRKKASEAHGASDLLRVTPTTFPTSGPQVRTNGAMNHLHVLWQSRDERAWYEDKPGFVKQSAFAGYLADGTPVGRYTHNSEWKDADGKQSAFATEPRTSLEITNNTRTAEDGRLYTVEFTRPNRDVAFLLRLNHASSLLDGPSGTRRDEGLLRLGGEARAATFETCPISAFPRLDDIKRKVAANRCFTVVLTTPAPFDQGWIPDGIDSKTGTGSLGGCNVQLVGAAVGRFQHLGGWNIVNMRPYPTHRAVPAGSVYFFKVTDDELDVDTFFNDRFGHSLFSDYRMKLGLGIAYLGMWHPNA